MEACLHSGSGWRVFDLVGFHSLTLCWKFSIQHREEGNVSIDAQGCSTGLLQPGADDLWAGFNTSYFMGNDKHFIWDEVHTVLRGPALEVAHVHHLTHVHVPQVVPSSTWQHLQCCEGEVGGSATLSEPVGWFVDRGSKGDMETGDNQETQQSWWLWWRVTETLSKIKARLLLL